jgi:hypothetical protein
MLHADDQRSGALLGRLVRLTRQREDFLTECFASVLQADPRAASTYWIAVSATLPPRVRAASGPVRIYTQLTAGTGSSRLDMRLERGRFSIGVEHKLFAPQGENQLPKYLSLPRAECGYVGLVTAGYQAVSTNVTSARRYAKPRGNLDHFLWSDFYPLLLRSEKRGTLLASATRHLFDTLGLNPGHHLIGDLRVKVDGVRVYDARLGRAWRPLLARLTRWGYAGPSIRRDRQSEVYISNGPSRLLREVWLDPISSPSSLRVRLKTTSPRLRRRLADNLRRAYRGPPWITFDEVRLLPSARGNHWAVELRIPWARLLRRTSTQAGLAKRLRHCVLSLMAGADEDAV